MDNRNSLEQLKSNNAKLKELKEAKINTRVYKWWLYFGR